MDDLMIILIFVCSFGFGLMFGWCISITQICDSNFKSLNYDNIVQENKQLKEVIKIKKKGGKA